MHRLPQTVYHPHVPSEMARKEPSFRYHSLESRVRKQFVAWCLVLLSIQIVAPDWRMFLAACLQWQLAVGIVFLRPFPRDQCSLSDHVYALPQLADAVVCL
jgi:hypothetical protein